MIIETRATIRSGLPVIVIGDFWGGEPACYWGPMASPSSGPEINVTDILFERGGEVPNITEADMIEAECAISRAATGEE